MPRLSRRHHYLPQCYLRRFAANDGFLRVFDREQKEFRKQTPQATAFQKDFYTVLRSDGSKSDGIEQMFGGLENVGCGVIKRLDSERDPGWRDEQERVSFAIFVALFYSRTRVFDQEQSAIAEKLYRTRMKAENPTLETTAKRLRDAAEEWGEAMEPEFIEAFHKMIRDDEYDVEVPRQNNIRLMVDAGLHLAGTLLTMDWTFAFAPADLAFITSDAPFAVAPPPGEKDWRAYGVLTPGAAVTLPLSPATCLVIQGLGGRESCARMCKDAVRRINHNVALNSDRFIIARDQPYLDRLVKRTNVGETRWTSRFEFEIEDVDGFLFHAKRTAPPNLRKV
jgi:hypothetical protein